MYNFRLPVKIDFHEKRRNHEKACSFENVNIRPDCGLELQTKVREDFTIMEKAPPLASIGYIPNSKMIFWSIIFSYVVQYIATILWGDAPAALVNQVPRPGLQINAAPGPAPRSRDTVSSVHHTLAEVPNTKLQYM